VNIVLKRRELFRKALSNKRVEVREIYIHDIGQLWYNGIEQNII